MTKTKKMGYELKGTCRELGDLKGKEYDYLGHFRKTEFQREGHNFMKSQKKSDILAAVSSGLSGSLKSIANLALAKGAMDDPDLDTSTPGADAIKKQIDEMPTPKLGDSLRSVDHTPSILPQDKVGFSYKSKNLGEIKTPSIQKISSPGEPKLKGYGSWVTQGKKKYGSWVK